MSNLILAVTVTCAAGSTAAAIAGNPMKGDGLAPTVTEGAWLIVNMGGGVFAQVPVAADATADNALTLLHPLPAAVTGVQGWVAVDPDKDSVAIATMQAVQAIRARFTPASVWFTGNGPPSNDIGVDGDLYRDYDESPPIEYRRDNGAWGISSAATVLPWNARGDWAAGTTYAKQDLVTYNGSSWLSRVDANTGNTPTTAAAQWQLVARSGDQILMGAGAPAAGLGVDGAAYINTSNGDLYKKSAGAWGAPQGNIKGPQGIQGAQGVKGDTGAQGPQGVKGDTGSQGPQGVKGDTGATGAAGPANSLAIGTVASGASAGATITGTAPNQTLNLTLPKGDTGATGATGPAGLTPKGAWSSATAYVVNDLVTSGGSSYRCKVAHTNQAVTNTTYWELFAQKGADGTGTGNVTGPAAAVVDTEVAIFDGTTGTLIKSGGVQFSLVSRLNRDQTYTQPQRFAAATFAAGFAAYFNGDAYIAERPPGDSSPSLACTSFVRRHVGNFAGFVFANVNVTLGVNDHGKAVQASSATPFNITLPVGGVWGAGAAGPAITIFNHGTADVTIVRQGSDFIYCPPAGLGNANTSLTLRPGENVVVINRGGTEWDVCGGSWLTSNATPLPPKAIAGLGAGFTVGDLLYADSTTTLAKLADVAGGNVLRSGGVGVAPSWGKVGLTTHITGTLAVANGGTGLTALGTALQVLRTNVGATAMEWATLGSAALSASTDFATAAQGAKADTAVQPAALTAYEKAGEQVGINTQTGTAYTLALTDKGKIVEMNNAGANTLTIPANATVAFPVNSRIDLSQFGAGQTTIAADAGVTIRSAGGKLKLTGQYSGATLYKRGTDEWVLIGDLAA
ncbi:carbohydrate-binding protein [Labrys portucalensis]|uniref:Carbohydrate-binding protein n=1 Tax=Labrys neptuniae TaxID=376174 RepID=A0ABV6Z8Q1_9HYPH